MEVVASLKGWTDVTPPGNHSYDTALADAIGTVRVQVKMQSRKEFKPWLRSGVGMVEVQRSRTGSTKAGEATRPCRFGDFDILAARMEPSHDVGSFFFTLLTGGSFRVGRSQAGNSSATSIETRCHFDE